MKITIEIFTVSHNDDTCKSSHVKFGVQYILTFASTDGDTGNEFKDLLASSSDEQSEHMN